MKVTCCDYCYEETKKLVEAKRILSYKGVGKIELCDVHIVEAKKMSPIQFTIKYYSLLGITMEEEEARKLIGPSRRI